MKLFSLFLRMFFLALPVLSLRCGSFNEMNLTGGAGAGNPGGTVSFALTIKNDSSLAKTAAISGGGIAQSASLTSIAPITIRDIAGLPLTVTSVQINCVDLRLILDYREESHEILDSLRQRPDYLFGDSQGIVINRRFSFDCMRGTPDSTVPPVTMPVARYTGVMLRFNQGPGFAPDSSRQSQILITGFFMYNGQSHDFRVKINRTFSPTYRFGAGIFTLSTTDTTHLEIRFDAVRWFHGVNFKQSLDQGQLVFDRNGELVIASGAYGGSSFAEETELRIRNNFINSGRLVVY